MSFLVSIAQALGLRAKPRLPAAARGRVVQDPSLWDGAGRIGGGLTPRQVSDIIRQADTGNIQRLIDLANECRQKDCHLHAVLSVNEEAIAGLKWQIKVPEDARAKDKRAAQWIEDKLQNHPGMSRLISNMSGSHYYGHDVSEIVWKREEGKLIPDRFEHIAPRRFAYRATDGVFVLRDTGMPQDGIDLRAKYPRKFIIAQPRVNGDAPQREGLARLLVWAALFRTWTVADWLKTAELSWKPWRIGTYKRTGTNTEDRRDLEDVLDQLSTNGWAAMPDTTTVQIHWPVGSNAGNRSTHAELVNILAQEMSKAVLGQTETIQASSTSGYAQARVHDAVRRDIRDSRARQLAAELTRDLIVPMTELNFAGANPGWFEFMTEDTVDLRAFSQSMMNFANARVPIPHSWIRQTAGIPEPSGDEPVTDVAPDDPNAPTDDPEDDPKDPEDDATDPPENDPNEPPAEDASKPKPAAKPKK